MVRAGGLARASKPRTEGHGQKSRLGSHLGGFSNARVKVRSEDGHKGQPQSSELPASPQQ